MVVAGLFATLEKSQAQLAVPLLATVPQNMVVPFTTLTPWAQLVLPLLITVLLC